MKRNINFFWLLYLIFVFLPLGLAITVISAVFTIMLSFVGDYKWCYIPAKFWGKSLCYLSFVRVKINGFDNYNPDKSYVFVCNHQSVYDVFVIYGWLDSKFKWIMKHSLRRIPFVGLASHKAGHIFIDRSSPYKAKKSIEEAMQKIKKGASIVVFPEGRRSRDGKTGKFKRGAFKIAEELKLDIVPISIVGSYDVLPHDSYYIKPRRIEIIIHKPVSSEQLNENSMNKLIEEIRNTIILHTKT